jgi:hypothetical protein
MKVLIIGFILVALITIILYNETLYDENDQKFKKK